MAVSVLMLVLVVLSLATAILWILALVDALRRPDPAWAAAGQNKLLWVLVVVFTGIVGAILYFAIARPALERARPGVPGRA